MVRNEAVSTGKYAAENIVYIYARKNIYSPLKTLKRKPSRNCARLSGRKGIIFRDDTSLANKKFQQLNIRRIISGRRSYTNTVKYPVYTASNIWFYPCFGISYDRYFRAEFHGLLWKFCVIPRWNYWSRRIRRERKIGMSISLDSGLSGYTCLPMHYQYCFALLCAFDSVFSNSEFVTVISFHQHPFTSTPFTPPSASTLCILAISVFGAFRAGPASLKFHLYFHRYLPPFHSLVSR